MSIAPGWVDAVRRADRPLPDEAHAGVVEQPNEDDTSCLVIASTDLEQICFLVGNYRGTSTGGPTIFIDASSH